MIPFSGASFRVHEDTTQKGIFKSAYANAQVDLKNRTKRIILQQYLYAARGWHVRLSRPEEQKKILRQE